MSASIAIARHYARCLAEATGGHPLVDATSPCVYAYFRQEGTQLFDVGYLDNRFGALHYVFSACHDRCATRNQDNLGNSIAPACHVRYTGADNEDDYDDRNHPGEYCYRSQTVLATSASADVSVPIPTGIPGVEASVGAEVSFSTSNEAGALLFLPQPHSVIEDARENLSSSYAKRHTKAWYRHVNETHRRGVRNGELYLITGCHKTKEWHNVCIYSSQRSKDASITFKPVAELGLTFSGHLYVAAEGMQSHEGPPVKAVKDTECVVVSGWKLYMCSRAWRYAMVPVKADKAQDSEPSRWTPYKSSKWEAPIAGFNEPLLHSSKPLPQPSDTAADSVNEILTKLQDELRDTPENEKILADSNGLSHMLSESECEAVSPSSHPLTEVFPYIEESAPWMETIIAHDNNYLSILSKGEYVPETKELATRLMQKFVIDVDDDMNGMLVDREKANLTTDEIVFVVHDSRHLTERHIGFDVIRKNIPSGWNLTAPRFGLGLPATDELGPRSQDSLLNNPSLLADHSNLAGPLGRRDPETHWKHDVDTLPKATVEPLRRLPGHGRDGKSEMGKVSNAQRKQRPSTTNVCERSGDNRLKLTRAQNMAPLELYQTTDDTASLKISNQRKHRLQSRGYGCL